jgi:hypothetical protein
MRASAGVMNRAADFLAGFDAATGAAAAGVVSVGAFSVGACSVVTIVSFACLN